MSSLINCPHCSHQIHESAITCPQCGAPNAKTANSMHYTSYSQVPWHRKWWFGIASAFVFWPLFAILIFTGDFYKTKNGEITALSRKSCYVILACMIGLTISRFFTD